MHLVFVIGASIVSKTFAKFKTKTLKRFLLVINSYKIKVGVIFGKIICYI